MTEPEYGSCRGCGYIKNSHTCRMLCGAAEVERLKRERDEARAERDTLTRMLVSEFGWEDTSYLHAMMHVENAIRNLRADLSVEVKERDGYKIALKHTEDAASRYRKERDEARAERDEACEELETLRALIEGEPWAGAVVRRERDEAREKADDLRKAIENAPCLAAREGEMTYECRVDNLCRVCRWRNEALREVKP